MLIKKFFKTLFISFIVIIITLSMTSCSVFSAYIGSAVRDAIDDSKDEQNNKAIEAETTQAEEESIDDKLNELINNSDVEFKISDSGQLLWRKINSNDLWTPVSSDATSENIVMRVNNGVIQWGYENSGEWQDLITADQLRTDTFGSLTFRVNDGYLQYGNQETNEWTNLMPADQLNINNYTIDGSTDFSASYTMRSVVSVICSFTVSQSSGGFWYGGGQTKQSTSTSAGSGVIYKLNESTGEAYIITNYHVVYNSSADSNISENINVYIYGSESSNYAIPATYVGGAMAYDIAVLHVESSELLASGFAKAADIGDSNNIYVGESIIVTGNPEGNGIAVNSGIINVDSEYQTITLADEVTTAKMRLIRVDAAINPGNSGGGLFDMNGKLIGITNSKLVSTSVDNVGYAIPSNIATRIANSIIYYCDGNLNTSAYRCLLGISVGVGSSKAVYDETTKKSSVIEDVIVTEIKDNCLLENEIQINDVIKSISINGNTCEVTRTFMVVDFMLDARVGDTVTLNIERDGQPMTITVTVTDSCLSII